MFFSAELLSRRDSGIGLLWLAATLGAKSSFRNLPRRSVMTADISQLCRLIKEPSEPLALRLSSNLMVGVVRVYKVKQEFLMTDVQNCFTSLKHTVHEMTTDASSSRKQHMMGSGTTRSDALMLQIEPGASFAIEFDGMTADWNLMTLRAVDRDDGDDDYGAPKRRRDKHQRSASLAEQGRAQHTLKESFDFFGSNSFESFLPDFGGSAGHMSAQTDSLDFGLDDNFMLPAEGLGLDGLGEELEWGEPVVSHNLTQEPTTDLNVPLVEDEIELEPAFILDEIDTMGVKFDHDVQSLHATQLHGDRPPSHQGQGPGDSVEADDDKMSKGSRKKYKSERLIIDASTELSSEAMKTNRAQYLEYQRGIRLDTEQKKLDQRRMQMVERMLMEAPVPIGSRFLSSMWEESLQSRLKPKKVRQNPNNVLEHDSVFATPPLQLAEEQPGDLSIEQPEQGRFGSHALSEIGMRSGLASPLLGHQTAVWDIPSSSVAGALNSREDSRTGSFTQATIGLPRMSRSSSRRASPVISGLPGDIQHGQGFELDNDMISTQAYVSDFAFAVPEVDNDISQLTIDTSNESDALEYAKTQLHNVQQGVSTFFDCIAPPTIATKHVAATMFYQCLVLATKDLVCVTQEIPHGTIEISKK